MSWLPSGMIEWSTLTPEPRLARLDDHAQDLVLLGSLHEGHRYWLCAMWGSGGQRSDFVHVDRPCEA